MAPVLEKLLSDLFGFVAQIADSVLRFDVQRSDELDYSREFVT